MKKILFAFFAILPMITALTGAETRDMKPLRPNILFIFSDDHALAAISAYRGFLKDVAPTPNIDRLATQGAIFERSYCANAICGPSRATVLTGKHSHKNGFLDNEQCVFDAAQPQVQKYLQQSGYQTALIGKWHLISLPTGFDYWEILPDQGHYYNPDFIQMDGTTRRIPGYCTDLIADKTIDWLKNGRDLNKPFMMMCQNKAPHRNWLPAERHYDLFKNQQMPEPDSLFDTYSNRSATLGQQTMSIAKDFHWSHDLLLPGEPKDPRFRTQAKNTEYDRMSPDQKERFDAAYRVENETFLADLAAGKIDDATLTSWKYQRYIKNYLRCIRAVDENVGRLLAYLDASGLAENTVVIYSADQGFYLGEHGWYDKRWIFEQSLSMPFLIRWPKVLQPGIRSQAMIQNIDYAPTFLDLAGIAKPADMQGVSLVPLLKNQGIAPVGWRDSIYYAYYGENTHHVAKHDGIRNERFKIFYLPKTAEWQLFDLEKDPQEMRSVHADPAYATTFEEMKRRYYALRKQYDADQVIMTSRASRKRKK